MSQHRSYFKRNNTLIYNSCANAGQTPIIELYYGKYSKSLFPSGFSRFIFDLDLDLLKEKIEEGVISTGCTNTLTHTLRLTNTSFFDDELLNTKDSMDRKRATSFDLLLFRIPENSVCTTNITIPEPDPCDPIVYPSTATTICQINQGPALWDEGVGYDHIKFGTSPNWQHGGLFPFHPPQDKSFSTEPSNWLWRNGLNRWSEPGIYSNTNNGVINFSGTTTGITGSSSITIIGIQHFEFGNEDIEFDMTNEINSILNGTLTGCTGWGIAFLPEYELKTGITATYSVGFFSRHTNTFYEPYLETKFNDLILDDRNYFTELRKNNLFMYVYEDGNFKSLDELPVVSIESTDFFSGFTGTSCMISNGIYKIEIPSVNGNGALCTLTDKWDNIKINGSAIPFIENDLFVKPLSERFFIGTESKDPNEFGFDFYGIKEDEKILNTDVKKIGLRIRKAFEKHIFLKPLDVFYRIYVREGKREVQVQDWELLNRTPNEYYFTLDTRDKIPNEYWVEVKINNFGQQDVYNRKLKFQIVSKK